MAKIPELTAFQNRFDEIDAAMAEPTFYAQPRRAAELTREHQRLRRLLDDAAALRRTEREIAEHQQLVSDSAADPGLRELAEAELPTLRERCAQLEQAILAAMLPPEPGDSRNTIVEIRAGAGGDEAGLFAGELGRERFDQNELYYPPTAILFGSQYVGNLLKLFPNQPDAAAASCHPSTCCGCNAWRST